MNESLGSTNQCLLEGSSLCCRRCTEIYSVFLITYLQHIGNDAAALVTAFVAKYSGIAFLLTTTSVFELEFVVPPDLLILVKHLGRLGIRLSSSVYSHKMDADTMPR